MVALVGFVLQFSVILFGFVYYWVYVIVAALLVCVIVFFWCVSCVVVFVKFISGSSIPGFAWKSLVF